MRTSRTGYNKNASWAFEKTDSSNPKPRNESEKKLFAKNNKKWCGDESKSDHKRRTWTPRKYKFFFLCVTRLNPLCVAVLTMPCGVPMHEFFFFFCAAAPTPVVAKNVFIPVNCESKIYRLAYQFREWEDRTNRKPRSARKRRFWSEELPSVADFHKMVHDLDDLGKPKPNLKKIFFLWFLRFLFFVI